LDGRPPLQACLLNWNLPVQRHLRLALGLLLAAFTAFNTVAVSGQASGKKTATAAKKPTRKTPAPARKKAPPTAAGKHAARKPSPAQASASRKKGSPTSAHRSARRSRTVRRAGQAQPSKERCLEIQEALKSRGYLVGEPDGAWGQDDAEALKRFQQDQNLEASGKLTSLSLIALGLGPKRTQSAQTSLPKAENK